MGERVTLIDYGAGNLHSVQNALKAAGAGQIAVTHDPDSVRAADRIVLPGVGSFAACAGALRAIDGMVDALEDAVMRSGRPFLGICVGMQLMADQGEEFGTTQGLGWIRGTVKPMQPHDPSLKIPHMGWNDVTPVCDHPLLRAGEAYFLHGFAFEGDAVLATTNHGGRIAAAIGRDTMVGVQFHPEKSQRYGLGFLESFLAWAP